MKAMILAAGLGTRLRPLTDNVPKALVKVSGRPMLDILLDRLIAAGFTHIIVNVHHLAQQISTHLSQRSGNGVQIEISDESGELLDTGGAITKAKWFLDGNEPFLVHNVDVLSNIDLEDMLGHHVRQNALATLAVSERISSRYFLFGDDDRLWGWENVRSEEIIRCEIAPPHLKRKAFSGVHVISPRFFSYSHKRGKFSIVEAYLELAASHRIMGCEHYPHHWFDLGKPGNIAKAEAYLKEKSNSA
jgi:NDP-sugar pyrophosphorylase family protein